MDWESFTPWTALAGGALIGTAASILLVLSGRVAGISGIIGGLLRPTGGDVGWRAAFAIGLLAGGSLMFLFAPESFGVSPVGLPFVGLAGILVGVGTYLGNGCTSGHGVCGLSRRSPRSGVATATFMTTGMVAATLARVFGGE